MINKRVIICFILSLFMATTVIINFDGMFVSNVNGQSLEKESKGSIVFKDPELKAELVVSGLEFPTSLAFIEKDDFLILEKETGLVKRVTDRKISEPLLQLNVNGKDERGLLGIDISKKKYSAGFEIIYVYLSYVECESKEACKNKVVRYELDTANNKLIYPKNIFSVESFPDDSHIGGILKVGPDDNVYVTVGDFHGTKFTPIYETQAQNFENGVSPDGRSGILRVSPDGDPISNGILGEEYPINLYFAYGIRNSFGIDFDPLTGYLWDTENGPDYGDEINLVEPGFNSGSVKIFGQFNSNKKYQFHNMGQSNIEKGPFDLVTFNGKGKYSEPELSWKDTVAPTAVTFLDSNALGNNYRYDMFVSNANGGKIYHFDLSQDRKQLVLKDVLADKVVDSNSEEDSITFAEGFTLITDLEMNPYDGSLYVVSLDNRGSGEGSVYKIVSTSPPHPIKDPTSPKNTIKFPSGIKPRQGEQLKNVQDQNTTNNKTQDNNEFTICNKLNSFVNILSDTWMNKKIEDEQVMYLVPQVKELMFEARCID